MITAIRIPGQPNRLISMIIVPMKPIGATVAASSVGKFIYIVLNSLESRLIILPIFWIFAV